MIRHLSTSNLYEPNKEELLQQFEKYNGIIDRIPTDLEQALKSYHKAKYCVLFSTGFWALVAAARMGRRNEGSEVIMPSFTYRRLADVAYWAGLIPVFVDVDPVSLSIDPSAIKKAISHKTALILAVHPIVGCCDVDQIIKIAQEHEIPVVFDAVESVHETINTKRIGSFEPPEVFSLHASKLLNGLEGGYVCTNNQKLALQLIEYRDGEYEGSIPLAIDPIHALFALQSLREIDNNVDHNRKIYEAYKINLATIPEVSLLLFSEFEQTSYKNVVAQVNDNDQFIRDDLVSYLNQHKIMARSHYSPPLHDKEHFFATKQLDLLTTEKVKRQFINLPCGQRTTLNDVEYVCKTIKGFIDERQ
jgi:dTDP-4-amino-4,6-dideoxygalactose transaminase